MPLSPGARLGTYEIIGPLGAGGMGEVYRALDSSLGRDVAIKVLPEAVAHHPERLARFEREARLLASLSHPNIAVVHGLERSAGSYYLVMELVKGETLAERSLRGAMPLQETLDIFKQIAEGLEAAHGQSIIHRDLKPANIMVTPKGTAKILDFGLAKVVSPEDSGFLSQSPTLSSSPTVAGIVMGTAAYMSPEQARGDPVDRRTDIWAFGCLLFEAVTGRRAFPGRTTSDTIATVLREEPDWSRTAAVAPLKLQLLLRRCLQKNPHVRLHDIADARIEIDDIAREPLGPAETAPVGGARRLLATPGAVAVLGAAAVVLIALGAVAGVTWWPARMPPAGSSLARVMITLPPPQALEKGRFPPVALSPDGGLLVYAAATSGGRTNLFLRPLDELSARPIAETGGASTPFFSPDGRWLAFYADGLLKKVSVAGGVPLTISDTPPIWSATWGENDRIVFATTLASSGLWEVSANGGAPAPITTPRPDDAQHGYPQLLPGGTQLLFSVRRGNAWHLALLALDSREWTVLGNGRVIGEGAQYLPTGHLVYTQSGGLVATPFDPSSGNLDQPPVSLLERVETSRFGGAYFAIAARSGTLVYVPAGTGVVDRTLIRADRDGRVAPAIETRGGYEYPAFSPDGRQLAVMMASETGSDIWIIDLERATRTRFTTDGTSAFPVWAPDGSRLAFQSTAPGPRNLFWKPLDGTSDAQPFLNAADPAGAPPWPNAGADLLPGTLPTLSGAGPQFPTSWSPDGSTLAFHERKPSGERDIWVVTAGSDPVPFLRTPFDERSPRFSPDGKWLAYVSDESGRNDVYVQPFPGPGPKWLVSTDGGVDPVWSRDSRELFYRRDDQMMAVTVAPAGEFSAGRPRRLFDMRFDAGDHAPNYDVSRDGTWFLMPRSEQGPAAGELHLVLDWFREVAARTRPERATRSSPASGQFTTFWRSLFPALLAAGQPQAPAGSAEAGVRDMLQRYSAALESLDANAVKKVQPSIPIDNLARAFKEMRELKVAIDTVRMLSIDGTTARVSCRVTQTLTPRAGSRQTTTVTRVMRLRRVVDSSVSPSAEVWVIDGFER
jgi:Tol biopolymer transport system component